MGEKKYKKNTSIHRYILFSIDFVVIFHSQPTLLKPLTSQYSIYFGKLVRILRIKYTFILKIWEFEFGAKKTNKDKSKKFLLIFVERVLFSNIFRNSDWETIYVLFECLRGCFVAFLCLLNGWGNGGVLLLQSFITEFFNKAFWEKMAHSKNRSLKIATHYCSATPVQRRPEYDHMVESIPIPFLC